MIPVARDYTELVGRTPLLELKRLFPLDNVETDFSPLF